MAFEAYLIKENEKVKLEDFDANDLGEWKGKKREAKKHFASLAEKIGDLQQLLHAVHQHKVLIVLQAMDSGGKDGTIRSVLSQVNPQGVKIANFKVPTPIELDHDYLWRVHAAVPGKGEMTFFNRSHYEDVLVVRVKELMPKAVWSKRFEHINQFEKMLADEGTLILKFYLHIDLEEQKQRFLERIEDPKKQWKFNPGDIEERKNWDAYQKAYEEVLNRTSTSYAPWYVVPANRNWYRNLIVASVIADALEGLQMEYPKLKENPEQYIQALESS